jgi:HK97 family phage major capsid protein
MTEGTLKLAKVLTAGQPAWHAENADDISDSGLTFGALVLTTKTLPVMATCSVELVEDLNTSMMAMAIENELVRSLAQELDRSALRGTGFGTEHVKGLLNWPSVTKTELGENGVQTTDHDWIVDAIARIWAQNLEPTAWLTSSAIGARIEKYKTAGAGADGQPLRAPRAVEQLPRLITNQIPSDLVVGNTSDNSEAYFGVWSDLLIGMRTSIRVEATRTAGDAFSKMQVLIRAYLRADVGVARGEAFQVVTGVRV